MVVVAVVGVDVAVVVVVETSVVGVVVVVVVVALGVVFSVAVGVSVGFVIDVVVVDSVAVDNRLRCWHGQDWQQLLLMRLFGGCYNPRRLYVVSVDVALRAAAPGAALAAARAAT